MKRIATLIGMLVFSLLGKAQQELQISQYMFNGLFLNPAYAGTHPYWSATALHRTQWVSFPGAPRTNLIAADGQLGDKGFGIGFVAVNDNIGLYQFNDISAAISYKFRVSTNSQLSLGLRAGVRNSAFNVNGLENIPDPGDPLYANAGQSIWTPKFDFGAYWYSDRGYLGLSIPNVLAIDSRTADNQDAGLKRHFFFNGGYVWDVNQSGSVKFKPSFLVKYAAGAPVSADLNAHFLFNDRLWLGVSYRHNSAVVAMIEFQMFDKLRIGYAFDATTTAIRTYQNGSHEIMLAYDFVSKQVKTIHPRYF